MRTSCVDVFASATQKTSRINIQIHIPELDFVWFSNSIYMLHDALKLANHVSTFVPFSFKVQLSHKVSVFSGTVDFPTKIFLFQVKMSVSFFLCLLLLYSFSIPNKITRLLHTGNVRQSICTSLKCLHFMYVYVYIILSICNSIENMGRTSIMSFTIFNISHSDVNPSPPV